MELDAIDEVNAGQYSSKKKKSGGFQSMNLIYPAYRAVIGRGFNVPTPIQRKTIPLIMEGRDVVACSKTGSGKTAAYMIPMIHRLKAHTNIIGIRALIILPTRELALQTASVFKQFAKYTDLLHSIIVGGHGFEGQYESLASNPDVLIATPGRLMQHLTETNLSLSKVEIVVVDEADYLFEKGYEEQIKIILGKLPNHKQVVLLSATIPEQLTEFARIGLKDYVFVRLDSEYTVPDHLSLNFFITRSEDKLPALIYFLVEHVIPTKEKAVVFAATKYHVDALVDILQVMRVPSIGIYGKMDQLARKEQLSKFKSNQCNLLIVTDLAARGIDIPHINHVINWDFPSTSKMFIHRCGRTARAGRAGVAYTFFSKNELMYLAELQIHLGRPLDSSGVIGDTSKAIYGVIPEAAFSEYIEKLKTIRDKQPEIENELETCRRAFKLFSKTRPSASKSAIRKSGTFSGGTIHPLFKSFDKDDDVKELYDKVKNYKPKVGYLEFKHQEGDLVLDQGAEKFLKNAKKIVQRRQELKAIKSRIQGAKEDDEESFSGGSDVEMPEQEEPDLHANAVAENERFKENLDPVVKKKVKKAFRDYKHPTQYISNEPSKDNPFNPAHKIGQDDVIPFVVADENADMQKQRKLVWDKKKKKYITSQPGTKIGMKRDRQDKNQKENLGRELYKKWSKKNMMKYQSVGEVEDSNITQKAKDLFNHRKKRIKSDFADGDEGLHHRSKKIGKKGGKGGMNELKRPEQIMKSRKNQIKNNVKNMSRGQRSQVLKKQKGAGGKSFGKSQFGGKKGKR